ncbi:hypothetical protein M2G23_21290 [Vibrio vulnificus]|nr:hypothetical protein [Vibrio vulnificus]MCU8549406.1 hypothetical protein [Vibrio vulnificus]MCU8579872.1 hypothetical protein [Vibrio vulnificus]
MSFVVKVACGRLV